MRRLVSWFLHTPTSNTLNVLPAGRAGWVERDGREAACVVRGVCGALFVSAGARKLRISNVVDPATAIAKSADNLPPRSPNQATGVT